MRRTLVELMFLALGLGVAVGIASLAVWAVPGTGRAVWTVAYGVMVIDVLLQLRPIRRAWLLDRATTQAGARADG
ncbi:hypothetical protein PX554_12515 [Sphingomonas sp. H39-1-10]|uniref:hypothetical protein n=1 Tax=Sphingomonas pollutisoli TaxID=3030829 RepID=UPI0023B93962|nr:hypothetical protein [Sphingomonas pollutisoli]MDF0488958.1 hypothetical protein [Sphingomonas pollutisoli]